MAWVANHATGHILTASSSTKRIFAALMPALVTGDESLLQAREALGLRTTYEGPEYPGFIAVGNDAVEFGRSPNGMEVHLEEQDPAG